MLLQEWYVWDTLGPTHLMPKVNINRQTQKHSRVKLFGLGLWDFHAVD